MNKIYCIYQDIGEEGTQTIFEDTNRVNILKKYKQLTKEGYKNISIDVWSKDNIKIKDII